MMKKDKEYKICKRCVMDTTSGAITFDDRGFCNYCNDFFERYGELLNKKTDQLERERKKLITEIKKAGKRKEYDCIIGVSGGVDSSWALVKAVELGLRPLAVHMDNGWNSELAQNNIENLIRKLGVDLYTYVIDWDEYRDLQKAFFNADVIDIELLYDNALAAVNYNQASKYSLRYILSGSNTVTEGVQMPSSWAAKYKYDYKNIKNIWNECGKGYKLRSFPGYGVSQYFIDRVIRKIEWVKFLDYFGYNKKEALKVLSEDYGYVPYLYKHYESVFTRFYQGYILPEKFNVDKRRNHLSSLILTGQMDRKEALQILKDIPYESKDLLNEDLKYFLKKFDWTKEELHSYLHRPKVEHNYYGSENYKMEILRNSSEFFSSLKSSFLSGSSVKS